ncbi:hypothetical protein HAZT_HAZT002351 [Hyalella azteca]|uniref:Uncharacterized protein n=1 Tax=Hyalella azteca TaxID=294128 RepID=A0A6A0H4R2_HYAAZ|nr:hypothetical protein HAZT_HAZT002351 [Hyalella azteca]
MNEELKTIQLRVTVAEHVPDGRGVAVGHVIVGTQATGKALSHWNQMMTALRKPIGICPYPPEVARILPKVARILRQLDSEVDWLGLWPRSGSYKRFTNLEDAANNPANAALHDDPNLPPQPLRPAPQRPSYRLPGRRSSGDGSPSPDAPYSKSNPYLDYRRSVSRDICDEIVPRSTNPFNPAWQPVPGIDDGRYINPFHNHQTSAYLGANKASYQPNYSPNHSDPRRRRDDLNSVYDPHVGNLNHMNSYNHHMDQGSSPIHSPSTIVNNMRMYHTIPGRGIKNYSTPAAYMDYATKKLREQQLHEREKQLQQQQKELQQKQIQQKQQVEQEKQQQEQIDRAIEFERRLREPPHDPPPPPAPLAPAQIRNFLSSKLDSSGIKFLRAINTSTVGRILSFNAPVFKESDWSITNRVKSIFDDIKRNAISDFVKQKELDESSKDANTDDKVKANQLGTDWWSSFTDKNKVTEDLDAKPNWPFDVSSNVKEEISSLDLMKTSNADRIFQIPKELIDDKLNSELEIKILDEEVAETMKSNTDWLENTPNRMLIAENDTIGENNSKNTLISSMKTNYRNEDSNKETEKVAASNASFNTEQLKEKENKNQVVAIDESTFKRSGRDGRRGSDGAGRPSRVGSRGDTPPLSRESRGSFKRARRGSGEGGSPVGGGAMVEECIIMPRVEAEKPSDEEVTEVSVSTELLREGSEFSKTLKGVQTEMDSLTRLTDNVFEEKERIVETGSEQIYVKTLNERPKVLGGEIENRNTAEFRRRYRRDSWSPALPGRHPNITGIFRSNSPSFSGTK